MPLPEHGRIAAPVRPLLKRIWRADLLPPSYRRLGTAALALRGAAGGIQRYGWISP